MWAVLGLALLLRAAYLVDLAQTPFFDHPQMDGLYHHQWARRIAEGDWFGEPVFFRAPLYSYFLGFLYTLELEFLGVRVVQFLIGSGTAFMTAILINKKFGRTAGLVAGFLVAGYGPLIYFEGELLLVVLEAPLNLLAMWFLDRAISRNTVKRWSLAGAATGLSALVRPTILALAPVVFIYLFWTRGRAAARSVSIFATGMVLVMSPALLHNAVGGRDLVPVASQGGLNYYLGNNPHADGMSAVAPEFRRTWTAGIEDARIQAEQDRGRQLRPSEVSNYWFGRALSWAVEEPGAFLIHQVRKLGYFWDAFEVPNNQDYYFFSRLTRVFQVPILLDFRLLAPLALTGVVLGWRERRLTFSWLVVPMVLMLSIVAFFVCARFRVSLVPLFAVWAGVGIAGGVDLVKERRFRGLALYISLFIVTGWAANADLAGHRRQHGTTESHLRLGIHYASQNNHAQAQHHYEQALAENPRFAEGWNNLGVLHAQSGDFDRARTAFETAVTVEPRHSKALGNLAALAFGEGRWSEADSLARRTLTVGKREPEALYNASVVLGNLGDANSALLGFRALRKLEPNRVRARLGEARALFMLGDRHQARETLLSVPTSDRTSEILTLLKDLETP